MTASCKAALSAHLREADSKVGDIHLLANFFLL